jgi:PAS domain S-box-containing protein
MSQSKGPRILALTALLAAAGLSLPAIAIWVGGSHRFRGVFVGACAAVFLVLVGLVARAVQRQVAALERARSEADQERTLAHLLQEQERRAAAELAGATEALRASEAFLGSLVENLPVAIYRRDAGGRLVFGNRRYCEHWGRSWSELRGKTDIDLSGPERGRQRADDNLRVMATRQPLETVEQQTAPDGKARWIHIIKVPVTDRDNRVIGTQGMFWDVTATKRVELDRALVSAFLAHVPDNVYFKDRNSRFIAVSASMLRFFGRADPAEIVGRTDADFFSADHAGPALADEQRILRTGESILGQLEREVWPDGRVTWAITSKLPLRNEGGEIIGTFGLSKDMTEHKRAEEALEAAKEAAEAAARTKNEFIANVSHEIRTPMNGIIGMTSLLLDTKLDPLQREFAETVRQSADALLTLVNDILDFAKFEAGKLAFEALDFDLVETVEGSVDMLAERAQAKGIELACEVLPEVPPWLRGDPGRLRQVLVNLVGNAIKFTERGEVVVRVVLLSEDADGTVLRFAVTDTGIGIPPEVCGRLFEAFTQADSSTTRRYGGTGLGLAISKRIVNMMRGEIGLESEARKGSTFWFTARFDRGAGPPADPTARARAQDLVNLRVLVVDDNATNRQILRHQLSAWRMQRGSAGSGPDALKLLRAAADDGAPYDAALLDMQMPEMDGLSLARAIKDDPAIAGTRLIILTSLGHFMSPEELKAAGIDAYLVKPVKQSRLFDCLANVMGHAAEGGFSQAAIQAAPGSDLLPAARILLAEDNQVNQKVAFGLLKKLGYHAHAVADGSEVIAALDKAAYDVIFMDCQMPEMDGYEATRLIRRSERDAARAGRGHPHVHIVAMTANALAGDREKCLAAGMDDYVSKPASLTELRAALRKWDAAHAAPRSDP